MIANHRKTYRRSSQVQVLLLSGWLLLGALQANSLAQITLDGSLGRRGSLPGPHYTIPADAGQMRGPNLFHSFGTFNVHTGESATFTGPNTIANILSRVTGGQRSDINGTLRSEIPGAHLYMLNPNGIVFGPNARLEVSGSFHVSTADVLRLADGGMFHADLAKDSVLTVAPPAAFGFLRQNPAAITIQESVLQVSPGQTLSVVGGDVAITGGVLEAPHGQIHIASVISPGEVIFPPPQAAASAFQGESVGQPGEITLLEEARLTTSGERGGTIRIRGGKLRLDTALLTVDTSSTGDAGTIAIQAEHLTVTGGASSPPVPAVAVRGQVGW